MQDKVQFGDQLVTPEEKTRKVGGVFSSVARRYDVMNDLMSGGLHRLWKDRFVARVKPRAGEAILDMAGGTGDVAFRMARRGAQVTVYDPAALERAREEHPQLNYADSMVEAARGADVVLLLTEWAEFREANPDKLAEVVARRRIVDGRNALDPTYWRASGWTYRALGRQ